MNKKTTKGKLIDIYGFRVLREALLVSSHTRAHIHDLHTRPTT